MMKTAHSPCPGQTKPLFILPIPKSANACLISGRQTAAANTAA